MNYLKLHKMNENNIERDRKAMKYYFGQNHLLAATELMPLMPMSYVLTARQSMDVHKHRDGHGVISSVHTYILQMILLLKVLQGKAGRGSKVNICPI